MFINPVVIRISRHHLETALELIERDLTRARDVLEKSNRVHRIMGRTANLTQEKREIRIRQLEAAHDAITDALAAADQRKEQV